jgi:hypothetical protein
MPSRSAFEGIEDGLDVWGFETGTGANDLCEGEADNADGQRSWE